VTRRPGKPHPEQDQIGRRWSGPLRAPPGSIARGVRQRTSQRNDHRGLAAGETGQNSAYRPAPQGSPRGGSAPKAFLRFLLRIPGRFTAKGDVIVSATRERGESPFLSSAERGSQLAPAEKINGVRTESRAEIKYSRGIVRRILEDWRLGVSRDGVTFVRAERCGTGLRKRPAR